MTYCTTYVVTSKFEFPMDMLRYDGAHPYGSDDARTISDSIRHDERTPPEGWQVKLECFHKDCKPRITFERWASFLWSVDRASISTRELL